MSIAIGLSKGHGSPKYDNYWRWLQSHDPDVEIVDLYLSESLEDDFKRLDLVVLTGGGDIHPAVYGHHEFADVCKSIDERRDDLEFRILEYAVKEKIPILGICRGLQIINVFRKGVLIPDLPTVLGPDEKHTEKPTGDQVHDIEIEPGSLLYRTVGETQATVNSSHHQGIATLGEGLAISSRSPDGVIESIEWREPEQQSFMLAVQWHPERMNQDNPVAAALLERIFLEAESARIYKATTPPLPKEEPEEIEVRDRREEGNNDSLFRIIQ